MEMKYSGDIIQSIKTKEEIRDWLYEKEKNKRKEHNTQFFIPSSYYKKLDILQHDGNLIAFPKKSTVLLEHGVNSSSLSSRYSHYYLCITKEHTEVLCKEGKNAYWVGSAFEDNTIPDRKNPQYLVYVPYHAEDPNIPILSVKQLKKLTKDNDCIGFYTSCTDDTKITNFTEEYNILVSNRRIPEQHFAKCKFLYENAKVIYADQSTTFTHVARGFKIPVIGEASKKIYTLYCDGNSMKRILYVLDLIIELEKFSFR